MPQEAGRRARISASHPLVGRIRRLLRSAGERSASGLMLAEGIHLAGEALSEGALIDRALVSPRLERSAGGAALLERLAAARVPLSWADDRLLASLHDAESHQGVLLVVRRPERPPAHLIPSGGAPALVLAAVGVQDPGNMGALVRLADAACASSLAACGGADPFGPKAARASSGSIFRLPVVRLASAAGAPALLEELASRGLTIAAALPRGGVDYRRADLSVPLALVVGGEGPGIPARVDALIGLRLTIPMGPRVESINVAAAAAVLLFAAGRCGVTIPRVPPPPGSSRAPAGGRLPPRATGSGPRPPR